MGQTSEHASPPKFLREHWSYALARLLDDAVTIPGTSFRIGLDPLVGLLPGIGDALGALVGGVIIYYAARRGAPKRVLVRMLGNVMVDYLVGIVPVLGDLFDAAFRSNHRNVELLRSLKDEDWGETRDRQAVGRMLGLALLFTFSLLVLGGGYLAFLVVRALFG